MSAAQDSIRSLVIVAGISGAGKSTALNTLEDQGYYVIDNLPVSLVPETLRLARETPHKYAKTALLPDIDSREKLAQLLEILRPFQQNKEVLRLLFLDCRNEMIMKRYGETRRPHPGFDPARDKTIEEAIGRERNRFQPFRDAAHFVLDTTELTVHDLRREIKQFTETIQQHPARSVRVNFVSFGFKFGVPPDCDLIVDVRFLPNPHFVDALREKNGTDSDVRAYVLNTADSREFLKKYADLLNFLLPRYVHEGKSYINIGVGCTGGKHRSVALAEALSAAILPGDFHLSVKHRDVLR